MPNMNANPEENHVVNGPIKMLVQFFEGDPDVRKVADDPALSAEILLLFRMILADGAVQQAEIDTLRRICREAFGIEESGLASVMSYLHDFGYETTTSHALAVMRDAPRERRIMLARHMAEIAKADHELTRHEVQLLARALEVLELSPEDVLGPSAPPTAG